MQLGIERQQLGLGAGDFVARHVGHVGVDEQVARGHQIRFALQQAGIPAGNHADLGVLARELQELVHVGHDVFARKQEIELRQALGVTFELASQEGFHAEGGN